MSLRSFIATQLAAALAPRFDCSGAANRRALAEDSVRVADALVAALRDPMLDPYPGTPTQDWATRGGPR